MDTCSTNNVHCVALLHSHEKVLPKYRKVERQTRGTTESDSRKFYHFIWDGKKQRLDIHTEQMRGKINSVERMKACRKRSEPI